MLDPNYKYLTKYHIEIYAHNLTISDLDIFFEFYLGSHNIFWKYEDICHNYDGTYFTFDSDTPLPPDIYKDPHFPFPGKHIYFHQVTELCPVTDEFWGAPENKQTEARYVDPTHDLTIKLQPTRRHPHYLLCIGKDISLFPPDIQEQLRPTLDIDEGEYINCLDLSGVTSLFNIIFKEHNNKSL